MHMMTRARTVGFRISSTQQPGISSAKSESSTHDSPRAIFTIRVQHVSEYKDAQDPNVWYKEYAQKRLNRTTCRQTHATMDGLRGSKSSTVLTHITDDISMTSPQEKNVNAWSYTVWVVLWRQVTGALLCTQKHNHTSHTGRTNPCPLTNGVRRKR